jgi:hypothetical protein
MNLRHYFKKSVEWTNDNAATKGLPRPYAKIPKLFRKAPDFLSYQKDILYLHPKVPIPYQTIPIFADRELMRLSKERENEIIDKHLCPYCGMMFDSEEEVIRWTTEATDQKLVELEIRVTTDNMPLHKECMEQAKFFCPFLRLTEDSEYITCKYKDIQK